jgi:hypothetical protein
MSAEKANIYRVTFHQGSASGSMFTVGVILLLRRRNEILKPLNILGEAFIFGYCPGIF